MLRTYSTYSMAVLTIQATVLTLLIISVYGAPAGAPEMCGTVESNEINSTCMHRGYKMYDWDTEMCCNGTVHPWSDVTFCCGSDLFDITSEVCCDEEVYPAAPDQLLGCCYSWEYDVSMPYDMDTELCCDGTIFVLPSELEEEEELIDEERRNRTSRSRRYLGNTTRRPPMNIWSGDDSELETSWSEEDEEVPMASPYECCANQIYNTETHVCCNDRVQTKGGNMACCGNEFFDSHTHTCCDAVVEEGEWSRMEYAVLPLDPRRLECCGLHLMNSEIEVCCDDGLIPLPEGIDADDVISCCGDQVIVDEETQFCCGGRVYQSYGDSTAAILDDDNATSGTNITIKDKTSTAIYFVERDCCLDRLYYTDQHICCDDRLYSRDPNNDVFECCYNTGTLYNVKTQLCCYPEVLEAPPVQEGLSTYFAEKTYCCLPDHEFTGRK